MALFIPKVIRDFYFPMVFNGFFTKFFDINIFQYISVRGRNWVFYSVSSYCLNMPKFMAWAISKKAQQPINKYVPNHANKQNTPTMGGAVFVFATVISMLLTADITNIYIVIGLISLVGFA